MGRVLVKDSPTQMALLVEVEVKGLREQVTEADLMVGKQVEVKSQVLKIIEMAIEMAVVEAFLWYVSLLLEETPKQVSKMPHMVEEGI